MNMNMPIEVELERCREDKKKLKAEREKLIGALEGMVAGFLPSSFAYGKARAILAEAREHD